jgi:hypothetical protein
VRARWGSLGNHLPFNESDISGRARLPRWGRPAAVRDQSSAIALTALGDWTQANFCSVSPSEGARETPARRRRATMTR